VKARPAEGVARGEDARDAARHALAALLEGRSAAPIDRQRARLAEVGPGRPATAAPRAGG
jgi:hypothetical protein